jgi:Cytochrome P450
MSVYWINILYVSLVINTIGAFHTSQWRIANRQREYALYMTSLDDPRLAETEVPKSNSRSSIRSVSSTPAVYDGAQDWEEGMEGFEGFDWHLEHARRMLEGPGFAPLRMTLWQPALEKTRKEPPGFFDTSKILINNALQMMGLSKSLDGAPLVQGVNTFKGSPLKLLSRVLDGNLQELAGGPLFLLLHDYYKIYGPVYKLAFGPKSFIVVSDPVMVKHILKVSLSFKF